MKKYIKVNTKDLYDNYEVKTIRTKYKQKIWKLLEKNDILVKI